MRVNVTLLGAQTCLKLNFTKVMVSDIALLKTVKSVNDNLQATPSVLKRVDFEIIQ